MPEIITSKENKRIKDLMRLQAHPSPSSFVIEGYHSVEVAFSTHHLKEVYCLEDPRLPDVKTYLVNEAILKKLSKASTPEKIIGVASINEKQDYGERILILDRLQDPGNIGTLLRTAASFLFQDIIFLKGTCSPFNNKAIASSEGALFHLRLHFEEDISFIQDLQKKGYAVYGSALKDAVALEKEDLSSSKVALILGNEGKGMSDALLSKTDKNLKISMENMESLNVAMAGAILMHAFYWAKKR